MAYVKVLAILLCSCFIQDALSGVPNSKQKKRQATETQAIPTEEQAWDAIQQDGGNPRLSGSKPAKLQGVNPKQTGVNPMQAAVNQKLAGVNQKVPPGVSKQGKVVNPRRSQRAAAVAMPPKPEYPYLEEVAKMFWGATEEINRDKENGNKIMRAVRNSMGANTDPAYWNALQTALRWYGKPTSDPIKAETRMRMCSAITDALTSPTAADRFLYMVSVALNAVNEMDVEPYEVAMAKVRAAVNNGHVVRALDAARAEVTSVVLDPAVITKAFNKIKNMINTSNVLNVTEGLANGLNKIGTSLNKQTTQQQPPPQATAFPYTKRSS